MRFSQGGRSAAYPFQTVLFDWEGTLVDFQWNLDGAIRDAKAVLVGLGVDTSGWENHYATLRNNAVLQAAHKRMDRRAVIGGIDVVYDRYDLEAACRWSLMPEANAVLADLRNRRVRLGLVTNIGRKALEEGTKRLGLAGCFDVIITRNDVELVKPIGDGIRMALARLGADKSAALFVGDSVSDILAAKDGGVRIAVIQGGESAPTSLIAAAPDYVFSALGELKTLYAGGESPG